MLAGVAVRIAGATPVPERAISTEVLEPFMVIDRPPLLAPADVGAKTTPNVVLWFGASVNGRLSPVKLKPPPAALACVIVMFSPPVFFKVSVCV